MIPHSRLTPAWKYAIVAISILTALPFWIARYFPSLDLPILLAEVFIQHNLHDATFDFNHFYERDLSLFGYAGFQLPVFILSYLLPLEVAAKIALSLYAIFLPLSFWAFLRSFHRDERAALLAVPFIYNMPLEIGLLCFLFAVPFIFYALACWQSFLTNIDQKDLKKRRSQAAGIVFLCLLTYLCHIQAALVLLALMTVLCFLNRSSWRQLIYLLPVVIIIGAALMLPKSKDLFRNNYQDNNNSPELSWLGLTDFITMGLDGMRLDNQYQITILSNYMLIPIVLLGIIGISKRKSDVITNNPTRWFVLPLLFAFTVAMLLATPEVVGSACFLVTRCGPIVALLFLATCCVDFGRKVRGLVSGILLVFVALARIGVACCSVLYFQQFMVGLDEVSQHASNGGRTLYLALTTHVHESGAPVLHHADGYLQMKIGGDIGFSVGQYSQRSIRYKPGMRPSLHPEWEPFLFNWKEHGSQFDRVLIHGTISEAIMAFEAVVRKGGAPADGYSPYSQVPHIEEQLRLIAEHSKAKFQAGKWILYELKDG